MALTRKFLNALGIEQDKIDEIIASHVETVDALKADVAKYKESAEKYEESVKALEDMQKELDALKADTSSGDLRAKYDSLEKEYKDYKESVKAEKAWAQKEKAFRSILKKSGIPDKRFDAIVKLSHDEIDKIQVDKDGNLKDEEAVLKAIDENWSDYKQTTGTVGADVSNPPANHAGQEATKSRARMLAEKYNEQMYGIKKEG